MLHHTLAYRCCGSTRGRRVRLMVNGRPTLPKARAGLAARLEIAAFATDTKGMDGRGVIGVRGGAAAVGAWLALVAVSGLTDPTGARAQTQSLLPSELTSPVPTAPGTGIATTPGTTLLPPPPPA